MVTHHAEGRPSLRRRGANARAMRIVGELDSLNRQAAKGIGRKFAVAIQAQRNSGAIFLALLSDARLDDRHAPIGETPKI